MIIRNIELRSREEYDVQYCAASLLKELGWLNVTPDETYQASKIFNEIDADKTGFLDCREFIENIGKMLGGRLSLTPEAWERAFVMIDLGGDGKIDYQEFMPLCLDLKSLINVEGIRGLFQMYDPAGTGKISI